MANVSEIWRYPVKSVRGESLQTSDFGENGLVFDRGWSLLDLASGNNLTARRAPALLMASARVEGGEVVMTLPDGSETADDEALCAWLNADVSLVRATAEIGGTYENPMDFENDADWVSWTGPSGAFHDSTRTRISMVSKASMGEWATERFRINLILDGLGAREEDGWVDGELSVGGVSLKVTKQIDRCVMVTRPQPGIERNLDVLREINANHARMLGIGTLPAGKGTVNVGDPIT
jgi:uncharacterized protein YcbX